MGNLDHKSLSLDLGLFPIFLYRYCEECWKFVGNRHVSISGIVGMSTLELWVYDD